MHNDKEMMDALLSLEKVELGMPIGMKMKNLMMKKYENGEEVDSFVLQMYQEFLEEINKEQHIVNQYMNKIFKNEE